jgi:D-alanyl-D-alanine dipeptidase
MAADTAATQPKSGFSADRPFGTRRNRPFGQVTGPSGRLGGPGRVPSIPGMTILLSDPVVHAIRVRDNGDPLVSLPFAPGVLVRSGLADRLTAARAALPAGLDLRVVEGHRSVADQRAIIDEYSAQLRVLHPDADGVELTRLYSRFVAPVAVAPHVAGAAVDLTLVDDAGAELWMGTPVDATPEQSGGACFFGADVDGEARRNRTVLADVLAGAGLVNYPTEWWHWSYGDRCWALMSGADHAVYGPVEATVPA